MKTQLQVTLMLAAAVYLGWGMSILLAPSVAHQLLSKGPSDPVTNALFGTALIGGVVMFVIAARDPVKEIVRASASMMALIGLTSAYLLFISKVMPFSLVTVASLVIDLGAAGVLFLTEARLDLARHQDMQPTGPH
ncbi:MAG TPA: hypothetical protein VFN52_03880 [Acidiferrobacteraceae bacterium]|nr:hypothetical protein [Acidiferrobacteraceae bacterium]